MFMSTIVNCTIDHVNGDYRRTLYIIAPFGELAGDTLLLN